MFVPKPYFQAMQQNELNMTECCLLMLIQSLEEQKGPVSQGELAQTLGVRRKRVSLLLQRLSQKGYLTETEHPEEASLYRIQPQVKKA